MRDIVTVVREAQLPLAASSLAYVTVLSIVPLLAVSFSIFQAFGGIERLYEVIEPFIIENLAQGSSEQAMAAIRGFIGNIHANAIGVTGFIGLIITSMSLLSNVENAINRVWKAPQTRTLFHRFSSYWLFITLGPIAWAAMIGFATSRDLPLNQLMPSGTVSFMAEIGFFFLVYKYVPARFVAWRPALIAGLITAILWHLGRWGYVEYTKRVLTYKNIYGGLAAFPILLVWIYIVWLIILTGAAVTSALQKRVDFK